MTTHLKHKIAVTAGVAAAIVAIVAVLYFYPMYKVTTIDLTSFSPEELEAIDVAQGFLAKAPTFAFDGIKDSVGSIPPIQVLKSYPPQYVLQFGFDSSHAGYGDRTGQVLAQVITPHVIEITVSDKKVTSAVIDKSWDELHQVSITQSDSSYSLQILTDKDQYKTGETINITITNQGDTRLFPKGWGYSVTGTDGQQYAPNGVLTMMLVALPPGESTYWTWDQLDSNSTQVNPGKYRITGSYTEEGTEKEVSSFKEIEITNN